LALMHAKSLKKKTIDAMLTEQIKVTDAKGLSWALGWGLQNTKKGKAAWQWGDNGTFKAFTMMYPSQYKGLVLLTNSQNGMRMVPDIVGYVFGDHEFPAFTWMDYDVEDTPYQVLLKQILKDGYDKAIPEFLHQNQIHHDTARINESRMSRIGDRLVREKRFEDAKKVYKSNISAFGSFKAHGKICRLFP